MRNWKLIIFIIIILAVSYPFISKKQTAAQIEIKGKVINAEIADNDIERAKGLSDRDYLAPDSGMLFIFPNTDRHRFWMKDTKIPLDIIWINDNKIVEIATLQPQNENDIPSYTPKNKANYVLEINANSGFNLGDMVQMNLKK